MSSTIQGLEDEIKGRQISVEVPVTAAEIIAMYTTPKLLVPAVSNKAIVVDSVEFIMTRTATQFTGGGAVSVQYSATANGAGTLACSSTLASTVITGTAGTTYSFRHTASISDTASATLSGIGLYLSNATAVFATGTGTAVVRVTYRTV